jgi:hypothetical protein
MWLKWTPWKLIVRKLADSHGFLDPMALTAKLRGFAQPSEVAEPIELLRAGAVMHARGLINSRVIQHNLDWVWPYWIEQQYEPSSPSFVPRAFSLTHINLTHRNWTAVGLPDVRALPIVDPRGLVTPHFDGWSVDAWIVPEDGPALYPSRASDKNTTQRLDLSDGLAVITETQQGALTLSNRVEVIEDASGVSTCRMQLSATSDRKASLVLTLRPYNSEGVSFLHEITLSDDERVWKVEGKEAAQFGQTPASHHISDYRQGDIAIHLCDVKEQSQGVCDVGMATAAAIFPLDEHGLLDLEVRFPLAEVPAKKSIAHQWNHALSGTTKLTVPDTRMQALYDGALRTLVLCSPDEVFPGTFTYKRFWFRDAAFMIQALLHAGMEKRAERAVEAFFPNQKANGYFHSQDGEWDSNGEALWAMEQLCRFRGTPPSSAWKDAIRHGARWIMDKRVHADPVDLHDGLMPAGFSAEHLGPNDYYYWDDFWSVAGLRSAARMVHQLGDEVSCEQFHDHAESLEQAVKHSLERVWEHTTERCLPASPYRRMDAGAIGSIAHGYPLQLAEAHDVELLQTVDFLLDHCCYGGGFFQDMVHSGINAYLTLHLAQVLLRAGDERFAGLMENVAQMASPTGQWPEAIHPQTRGGCMGDGQHGWAAADWIVMLRNCFVREEGDALMLCQGVSSAWLDSETAFGVENAPTQFGSVTVSVESRTVRWKAQWHTPPREVIIALPGSPSPSVFPGNLTHGVYEARLNTQPATC